MKSYYVHVGGNHKFLTGFYDWGVKVLPGISTNKYMCSRGLYMTALGPGVGGCQAMVLSPLFGHAQTSLTNYTNAEFWRMRIVMPLAIQGDPRYE